MADGCFYELDIPTTLRRLVGQTVTVYTSSGGCSGSGFTGVVVCVDDCVVKLLTRIGTPPDCAVGSPCCCPPPAQYRPCGGVPYAGLGSVTVIPLCQICAVVQNAIA